MLSPDYFVGADKQIQKYLTQLEDDVLRDVARHLKTATAKNQMEALIDLDHSVFTMAIKLSEFSGKSLSEIIDIMDDAGIKSYYDDKELYSKGKKHLPDFQDNLSAMKFVEAIKRQSGNDLKNITRTTGLAGKGLNEFYRTELSQAVLNLRSGAFSSDQVIRQMVNKCADRGLVSINYASGRTMRMEAAVRMCINTGFRQLTTQMGLMNAELVGQDLMEISAHAGARPTHQEWQGKIVSLSGKPDYLSLDDIGYGSADGFSGVNCRHSWYPFFEGISEPLYTDYEESKPFEYKGKTYTEYDANQYIRKLENSIKKEKRKITMYDELGDEDSVTTHKVRAQRLRQERDKFKKRIKMYDNELKRYNKNKPKVAEQEILLDKYEYLKGGIKEAIKNFSSISDDDFYLINKSKYRYVQSARSFSMNSFLRDGDKSVFFGDEEPFMKTIETLKKVIESNTTHKDFISDRYVDGPWLKNFISDLGLDETSEIKDIVKTLNENIGYTQKQLGFISTSVTPADNVFKDRPVKLEIFAPKGTHCYATKNVGESEIIFNSGVKFNLREAIFDEDKGRLILKILLKE